MLKKEDVIIHSVRYGPTINKALEGLQTSNIMSTSNFGYSKVNFASQERSLANTLLVPCLPLETTLTSKLKLAFPMHLSHLLAKIVCSCSFLSAAKPSDLGTLGAVLIVGGGTFGTYPCAVFQRCVQKSPYFFYPLKIHVTLWRGVFKSCQIF